MGILSGLENLGVNRKDDDIYADNKNANKNAAASSDSDQRKNGPTEEEFILERTYTCPVCGKEFKALTVKSNRARLIGTDIDLRPKFEQLDTLKYDVLCCPNCGYSALSRYFNNILDAQKKLVLEKISSGFHHKDHNGNTYTYEEAIENYQLALANAIVMKAKSSVKAYICLKMAWVVRGYQSQLSGEGLQRGKEDEKALLQNALDGFINARATEDFPMCGMDEETVDYLISALFYECGKNDSAIKMLSDIIVSHTANTRIKDRARDLKDRIMAEKGR